MANITLKKRCVSCGKPAHAGACTPSKGTAEIDTIKAVLTNHENRITTLEGKVK